METQLQQIPLAKIVVSGDNHRRINEKDPDFLELKASIAAGGVRIPIHVRQTNGKYELRAGERRFLACKALKLETIPALVHTDMADAEALDLMYVENKFRKDLTPLEEAAEVAFLAEKIGDTKVIAEKIGRSEQWVRLRANIHIQLIPAWKTSLKEPEFASWTAAHLVLLARLPANVQRDVHEDVLRQYYYRKPSVGELEGLLANRLRLLSHAKWDLEDATLAPKAGACTQCQKRSGFCPILWDDPEESVDAGDRCLDAACYGEKMIAYLQQQAKALKEKHPSLVLIRKDSLSAFPGDIETQFGPCLREWEFAAVKKIVKGAVPAMYLTGKSAGKLTWIKPTSAWAQRAVQKHGGPTRLSERRAKLDARRWAQVLLDLKEKLAHVTVKDLVFKQAEMGAKADGLMALVAVLGNSPTHILPGGATPEGTATLLKAGREKILDALWRSFIPTLAQMLTYGGPITQTPEFLQETAAWVAELIGVDLEALRKEISERKGFTEPKAWANLKADGTPKGTKATEPKKEKKAKASKTKRTKAS